MTAKTAFRAAYTAARAGCLYFEMPFYAEAAMVHEQRNSNAAKRYNRWLSRSIPDHCRSGINPVDVARWLVPARAALYAVSAMRRAA